VRLGAFLVLLAAWVHAGVIQGVALENASGRPLARTIIRLEPVPQAAGNAAGAGLLQTRTSRTGTFGFLSIPAGLYSIVAQREGFLPTAFGQRRPAGQGTPVEVTAESKLFAEIRMPRMGAITGRVLDGNGVGIQGVPVLAYRARLPLRSVASAVADDRGVYRIAGLAPGKYWVRSGAYTLDDGTGLLPTFGPAGREIHDARVHEVRADAEAIEANVEPEPGALFRLSGKITCDRVDIPYVTVTLSSETGRRSMQSLCNGGYAFDGLAPGAYEVFAAYSDNSGSGFVELQLDRYSQLGNVQVMSAPQVEFEVRSAANGGVVKTPVDVIGRRDDLSGSDAPRQIATPRAPLPAGHWELNAIAPSGQYVQAIGTNVREAQRPWRNERPPEWFEAFIPQRGVSRVQIAVSDQAGQIGGAVTSGVGNALPGAMVFLWPVAEAARRSLGGPRQAVADTAGKYRFDSLPPGDYRLFASFDFSVVDLEDFDEAQAPVFTVQAGQTAVADLRLWVAP
jgi:protocatechuate 3,4-dioxygenase beta subunit